MKNKTRTRIFLNGIVQGVGFRPFVYRLAKASGLTGFVRNTTQGVLIEVEGSRDKIEGFVRHVQNNAPARSRITEFTSESVALKHDSLFDILISSQNLYRHTLISPDLATCPDCLSELFDQGNRRYRYPLINCMHCGPRYTIIQDIPYDRKNTTMQRFHMCGACLNEFNDPENRRFHAQPNACPECGPKVLLTDGNGKAEALNDPVGEAIHLLKNGAIVAVKGLGGFHLACDADNQSAVKRLRQRKQRDEKPFAVMARDIQAAHHLASFGVQAEALLQSCESPIVLLERHSQSVPAADVAPGNRMIGIMLPYTPVHHLLMQGPFTSLVMTSGNISEEPIVFDNPDAFSRLKGVADYFLIHDRPIHNRTDDSVFYMHNIPAPVRRSRGYVPVPVFIPKMDHIILAVGGELKNTIAFLKHDQVFLSQHIGDLKNADILESFEQTILHVQNLLSIKPEAVAYDLHPDYMSSRWARQQKMPGIAVQHHHAHIASCLAENRVTETVMGIALDGTGYGSDGHLWGGELMVADYRTFERIAHFSYAPLPGGERAIREPWRMALSYLYSGGNADNDPYEILDLPVFKKLDSEAVRGVIQAIQMKINTPLTSGAGRLFDAVSFLCGCTAHAAYEGQPAVMLEQILPDSPSDESYEGFEFNWKEKSVQIKHHQLFRMILKDLCEKKPAGQISLKFHNALVELFVHLISLLSKDRGLKSVALSGGCFQNKYLLITLARKLEAEGYRVYTHSHVPCNDGGLSLGQAVIAAGTVFS